MRGGLWMRYFGIFAARVLQGMGPAVSEGGLAGFRAGLIYRAALPLAPSFLGVSAWWKTVAKQWWGRSEPMKYGHGLM